jgi:outer membrane protein assembly factor BamB
MMYPKKIARNYVAALLLCVTMVMLTVGSAFYRNSGYSADPIWIFDSDLTVAHVETADLDNDGIKDVIAGEYSSNYYGEPSRVYALDGETGDTIWTYLLQDGVRSMTSGDLDNDGVKDAVAGASYNSGNTPDGQVHAISGVSGISLWTFPIGATIQTVTVANLNGDEYPDVSAGAFNDSIYGINGQTGGLLWKREIDGLWINAVDGADVNDDGIDDIGFGNEYLTGYDNHCGVLDGTDGSIIWDSIVPYLVMDVLMTNIDGDAETDAFYGVIYGDDHGEVHSRDAATGVLEWSYNLGPVDHSNGNILLRTQDLDEDGAFELIVGTYLGEQVIHALPGDASTTIWVSDTLQGHTRDIAFGDVTGDKDVNVIAAGSDRIEVLDGLNGSFLFYYSVNGSMYGARTADFDGDETSDIAAGGGADFSSTPPNPAKGVWALKTVLSPVLWEYDIGEYGNSIALGDFNNDGCQDVVSVASIGDNAIGIDGLTGTELWTWQGTQNLYTATAGDFNNDGYDDAAVAGADDMVTAIDGNTGLSMWQFTDPTDQLYRKCLKAADLNGDDNVDVIAGADDNMVYAIRGENGVELWSQYVGGEVNDNTSAVKSMKSIWPR